jgi:hypothetical protein
MRDPAGVDWFFTGTWAGCIIAVAALYHWGRVLMSGRKHGSSSGPQHPGTQANLRKSTREQRRAAIRDAIKQTGGLTTGDARIVAACMRNELGYCVIHNAYDAPEQPRSVFHRQ